MLYEVITFLSVSIVDSGTHEILSWHHAAVPLKVVGSFYGGAAVQFQGNWLVEPAVAERNQSPGKKSG